MNKHSFFIMLAAFGLLLTGCVQNSISNAQTSVAPKPQTITKAELPKLPAARKIADGIVVHEAKLNPRSTTSDVWIYLPEKVAAKEKLPVVLITAAGSYQWNGETLSDGDRPEHLPYVKAGYAVVAYETDGDFGGVKLEDATDEQMLKVITDFKNSRAGLTNQKTALDYALREVAALDAERIYVAGHSSAATHALLVAANEPRVKAVIAYAPATDVEKRLSDVLPIFEEAVSGFTTFIAQSSPKNNIGKIKVPAYIFHADDDSVIPIADTAAFAAELKKSNPNVTFETAKSGDHYDSMIAEGVPRAIQWLNKISKKQ